MKGCAWHQLEERAIVALNAIGLEYATINAIVGYVNEHRPVGDFLESLVSDKLVQTFQYADDNNSEHVRDIVGWFYNHPTAACWHDRLAYQRWLAKASCEPQEPPEDQDGPTSPDGAVEGC